MSKFSPKQMAYLESHIKFTRTRPDQEFDPEIEQGLVCDAEYMYITLYVQDRHYMESTIRADLLG